MWCKRTLTIVDSPSPKCFDISFSWLIDWLIILSERAGEEGKLHFLQEIELMKEIGSHRNVVSMLGYWIRSEPIMLILEYVPHGDLLQWLRNKRHQVSVFLKVLHRKDWGTFNFKFAFIMKYFQVARFCISNGIFLAEFLIARGHQWVISEPDLPNVVFICFSQKTKTPD